MDELRANVEAAIASDDAEELVAALIEIALGASDRVFAQRVCLQLIRHENANVRGRALIALVHLASRLGELDREVVGPAIEAARRDPRPYVREQAEVAAEEIAEQLGWGVSDA